MCVCVCVCVCIKEYIGIYRNIYIKEYIHESIANVSDLTLVFVIFYIFICHQMIALQKL